MHKLPEKAAPSVGELQDQSRLAVTSAPALHAAGRDMVMHALHHPGSTEKTPLLGIDPSGRHARAPGPFLHRAPRSSTALKLLAGLAAVACLAAHTMYAGDANATLQSPRVSSSASPFQQQPSSLAWKTEPFNPTSLPLAARSPYLNVWLEGGNRARQGLLTSQYASAFNGNWLPWVVGILVDGQPYTAMSTPGIENGLDGPAAEQISMSFTPSSTSFTMRAGPVDLLLEFLSPITPDDLVRQTLPYSYLTLTASSNDGKEHQVELYTDIDAKFVSNDWESECEWSTTKKDGLIYHQVFLKHRVPYGEYDDFTTDGSVVYATSAEDTLTFATGPGPALRRHFQKHRSLSNERDGNFRQIKDNNPALAFAQKLGSIGPSGSKPFRLSIGRYRSPAISWTAMEDAHPDRELVYHSRYPSLQESLLFFHRDFDHVFDMATKFGSRVKEMANAISTKYYGLVALAARQCFVGTEVSVGKAASGEYNTSDIMSFTKEIATSNYISTVDIVYPAFPFYLFAGNQILKSLMEPILRYTASGKYPNAWCLHDLGYKYPNATGHDAGDDEAMFIEETAGMLIMQTAYVMATGDTSQLTQYYKVFRNWAIFLEGEALCPRDQVSSDDFQGNLVNSTNLAVKGIVGIGAMARLAEYVGDNDDASRFRTKASFFVGEFLKLALSSDGTHVKLTYQDSDETWVLLYHLFGDKLLGLNLFPDWLYAIQERWYQKVKERFGVRLDTRSDFAKSDWQIMAAAAHSANPTVRDIFVDGVYDYLEYGTSRQPFPDAYHMDTDEPLAFIARPVVGAVYSLLAMDRLKEARENATRQNLVL